MKFLELPIPEKVELGDFILKYFKSKNSSLSKDDLNAHVREHLVYFQNKPVPFLPFKIFKKGKAQLYLKQTGPMLKKNQIIYEDKWVLVINKPSGLPSQSSLKFLQDHAHSMVQCYLREKKFQTSPVLFLMHRLDTDTSGLLLFSKKASANKSIQQQFETRCIKKTYLALSTSSSESTVFKQKVITSYIAKKGDNKHAFKFASVPKDTPGARRSETLVTLLSTSNNDLKHLFSVEPKTGRSHQIRVHLKDQGLAIDGDSFYDGEKASQLHLHAWKLSFKHPINQEPLNLVAPLPEHLKQSIDKYKLSL